MVVCNVVSRYLFGDGNELMLHSITTYEPWAWLLHFFFGQNALASQSFAIVLSSNEVAARAC